MNITGKTVTTRAEETTTNAQYRLEYSTEDNNLVKVEATVSTLPEGEHKENRHLGYIIFENGNIHCSLPSDTTNSKIFTDFEKFLATIKAELTTSAAPKTTTNK